jgi:hemolysin
VRTALSKLLSGDFKAPPANISYSYTEVNDEQHYNLALGANYEGTINKAKGSVKFDYEKKTKFYLVKVQQVYYTVDIDQPKQPAELFLKDFDYKKELGTEKPVYVSSVKYGRVLLLGIKTSLDKASAETALSLSFLGGKLSADAQAKLELLKSSSRVQGRVLGGNGKLAGGVVNSIDGLKQFLEEGAIYDKDNPGIPIAYKMRELGTNDVFKTVIYSKYTKHERYDALDFKFSFNKSNIKSKVGSVNDINAIYFEVFPKGSKQAIVLKPLKVII